MRTKRRLRLRVEVLAWGVSVLRLLWVGLEKGGGWILLKRRLGGIVEALELLGRALEELVCVGWRGSHWEYVVWLVIRLWLVSQVCCVEYCIRLAELVVELLLVLVVHVGLEVLFRVELL